MTKFIYPLFNIELIIMSVVDTPGIQKMNEINNDWNNFKDRKSTPCIYIIISPQHCCHNFVVNVRYTFSDFDPKTSLEIMPNALFLHDTIRSHGEVPTT